MIILQKQRTYFLLTILLLLIPVCHSTAQVANTDFSAWLEGLRLEAMATGIRVETLDRALSTVQPLPWIIKLDRNQPEFKKSLNEYLSGVLSKQRIQLGREKLYANKSLFNQIEKKYAVQPRFIVALWGIETYYGRHTGKVPIIDALVTLAHDGRRGSYFRKELLNALKILDAGHITYEKMIGSWAGAMGQVQFMPSSFLRYAVDGNNDQRIDLWQTPEDYLASAANYLAKMDWQGSRTWGREVLVPHGLEPGLVDINKTALLKTWQKYGVRRIDGADLPQAELRASLIQPEGKSGRSYLIYDNYRALMKWNRSNSFAIAVGMLADQIGGK